MKKIFLLLSVLLAFVAHAQQWVSTSPQNKKVVLEEFTGQTCQYCPDGHRIATDLKKANEGNVFLINIHAGGYATPSASYPMDLRTTVGTAIDAAAGISGYPAGSVNRADVPWGQSRSLWTTKAATIMSQTSPVNVYVKASVDTATRLLTTEVEVYYTATGTGTKNNLTVALLQNNILGKQIDGGNFNPTNWYNGQYVHSHVLRQHITSGTYGVSLDTLTQGKYYYKKFLTNLPSIIGNVNLDLYNLEVVAFVSEGNNNIISGYEATVMTNNPNKIDLVLKDSSIYPEPELLGPTHWCDNKMTPRIVVTNKSNTTVTSFDVTAIVNGVSNTKTFTGSLSYGQSTVINWGQINANASGYFSYSVSGFSNINGGTKVVDFNPINNLYSTAVIGLKSKSFIVLKQGFDSSLLNKNTILDDEGSNIGIAPWTSNYGADSTADAVFIPLYGSPSKKGHIIIGEADLVNAKSPQLTYYYAYSDGSQGGSAPSIQVSYSVDCGQNWTNVGTATTCLQTGAPSVTTNYYIPTSAEYKQVTVDLASLIGKSCLIRITGQTGQTGNALYIDQIELKNSGTASGGSSNDTFFVKVTSVASASKTYEDLIGNVTMSKDSSYTWKVTNVTLPAGQGWSLKTICDAIDCVNYPAVQRNTFVASGNPTKDIYKVTIDHAKKAGYGYAILKTWKGKDSVAGARDLKFSLLTTTSASIGLVSDASDKLLYYFDNKLFVDRDFRNATIEVYDINGKVVMNSKVNSDQMDFNTTTGGIYIARVLVDGQVAKTHKFSTAK